MVHKPGWLQRAIQPSRERGFNELPSTLGGIFSVMSSTRTLVQLASALLFLLGALRGNGQSSNGNAPALSVCEVIAKRIEFNGQMVQVRGEVRFGGHGPYLVPSSVCPEKVVTRGVEWPNVIYLAYPISSSPNESDHAAFRVDWQTIRKTEGAVRRAKFNPDTDVLTETYAGLFVTYLDLEKRVNPGIPGALRLGFGPVGLEAPAQLLIQVVTDAVVIRQPRK